jgi:uncharacterized protein (TIGR00290 family)
MPPTKIWLSWSSGKDSAWAIHELRNAGSFEVTGLITTINRDAGRVAMHAVREELVEAQAQALGVPLLKIPIPAQCSNAAYDSAMEAAMAQARMAGIQQIAFGDLFLEDIRRYREERLQSIGMKPVFPLWLRPTAALAREMIDGGLRAYLTCVDPKQLEPRFAGREFDKELLDDLPGAADPCGEKGEFHTFAFAGPMFSHPLPVVRGETVTRDGFVFADVLPDRTRNDRGQKADPALRPG